MVMNRKSDSRSAFFIPCVVIGSVLYAAGLALILAPLSSAVAGDNGAAKLSISVPAQATGGTWTAPGDLAVPREHHTATLLPNGDVLVTGGRKVFGNLASAQVYHSAIGRWQRIANMNHQHGYHTATLLPTGQVLVAGG